MFKTSENFIFMILASVWLFFLLKRLSDDLRKRKEIFASDHMLKRITGHKVTKRPVAKWALLVISFLCLCIALARPVGGVIEEAVIGSGLDLVVALDVSTSMRAMDIDGNQRLDVGKALVQRLLNGLKQDRIGLVIFAGDTMVQSPLTYDKGTFLTFLERCDPSLLTKQGTNIAAAIETSIDRFDMNASQARVIVLVTDGEDKDEKRLQKAVDEAKRKNIPIFTVGIGSRDGAPIPEARDSWGEIIYKKYQGQTVITKLEDSSLKKISRDTGASYFRAEDGRSAVKVAEALGGLKRVAVASGTRTVSEEIYYWPVLAAFLLLAFEWMISDRIPYEREKDHWLKRL
ncbi:MAG: VWA domain-containing protein [Candidatus Riflebacteria bacterium]|nr:VWA domain-containing protein [Candidatus Riflebacteria bacterium]